MKKIPLLLIAFCGLTVFAQKTKPVIQATFVSTTVNAGTKHHFSDNTTKRELSFTLDAEAKLNGEVTIKDVTSSALIFHGIMKDDHLVDSAMWFENNNLVRVVHFNDKCCTSKTDYVHPTSQSHNDIKGEKTGIEKLYYASKPGVLKAVNNYQSGKKHGKQFEYDSTKTLVVIRNYKDDQLHDTSFINCHKKTTDIEIYNNGVPTGAWKKYSASGTLAEVNHKSAGSDSTLYYQADAKLSKIVYRSAPDNGLYTYREYNAKSVLTKQYFTQYRTDSLKEVLQGMYEEYTNGKISLRGEYWLGTKVETWITYNAKGSETNWESFVTRDVAMATNPGVVVIDGVIPVAAEDIFPPVLSKASITMEFASNGKIEKLFKKTEEINWTLEVRSSTDHTVICTEKSLTDTERADVVDYITSSITTVKGVRYSHKEIPSTTQYKLVFK
jgi:antitoxin component YwqK of YwqJK toxin-antitoxin module